MPIYMHGTPEKYAQGCRCNLCELVHNMHSTKPRMHSTTFIDATETRDHINALRASGWLLREIAEAAGYHENTLREIGAGRTARVNRFLAEDVQTLKVRAVA